MHTNNRIISTGAAVLAAATLLIAMPTAAVAGHQAHHHQICPAIDDKPLCEIMQPRQRYDSAGTSRASRPANDSANRRGDLVHRSDNPPGDTTSWIDDRIGCRLVPRLYIVACPG